MTNRYMHMICWACYGGSFTQECVEFTTPEGEVVNHLTSDWHCADCGSHRVMFVTTQRMHDLRGDERDVDLATWEGEGGYV